MSKYVVADIANGQDSRVVGPFDSKEAATEYAHKYDHQYYEDTEYGFGVFEMPIIDPKSIDPG